MITGRGIRASAKKSFDKLEGYTQSRIVSKLDEIVDDEWREPTEYVEPLTGSPHGKIRVGNYRLGVSADRGRRVLIVYDMEHRSGAYKPGDD